MERTSKRCFSLIELPIVMAIVTALTGMVSLTDTTIFKHGRETAALGHIRAFQNAQTQFYPVKRRFAPTLKELSTAKIIPEHLATGTLGSYTFELIRVEEASTVKPLPNARVNPETPTTSPMTSSSSAKTTTALPIPTAPVK